MREWRCSESGGAVSVRCGEKEVYGTVECTNGVKCLQ